MKENSKRTPSTENPQSELDKVRRDVFAFMRMLILMALFHAYVGRPLEPRVPNESELIEITGMAKYEHANSTKSSVGSSGYLRVNGQVLHCQFGYFGASGGCDFPGVKWDKNKPVRATYFWMRTRLGFKDPMLHSLTQNGQEIISPQRTFDYRTWDYKIGFEIYYQQFILFPLAFALLGFGYWKFTQNKTSQS